MKETSGADYLSSHWAKVLAPSEAKMGKSCFLIASALGVLPWQRSGGVVDLPKNLHVLSCDSNALGGIKRFLLETCGAPKEALEFRAYNLQEDVRKAMSSPEEYDYALYNLVMSTLETIKSRAKGVPVVMFSSLTVLVQAIERSIAGPPGQKHGGGMDQSKWGDFARLVSDIRVWGQQDLWHCIWEAHVYKPPPTGQDNRQRSESLQISGKSAEAFANNVEQIFRIRRQFGQRYKDTKCEKTYLDCRPTFDFIANGRNFTEACDPVEYDLTKVFMKLGLKVGHWGQKDKSPS